MTSNIIVEMPNEAIAAIRGSGGHFKIMAEAVATASRTTIDAIKIRYATTTAAAPIKAEGCSSKRIIVVLQNSEYHPVTINSAHTVDDLKNYFSTLIPIPSEELRLVYRGLDMVDRNVLLCYVNPPCADEQGPADRTQYGVEEGEAIHLRTIAKSSRESFPEALTMPDLDEEGFREMVSELRAEVLRQDYMSPSVIIKMLNGQPHQVTSIPSTRPTTSSKVLPGSLRSRRMSSGCYRGRAPNERRQDAG